MIQNQHQYQITQNQLKELERGLIELLEIKDILRPRQFSARQIGFSRLIKTLKQDIV